MRCEHWESGACHSCALIEAPYPDQLADKARVFRADPEVHEALERSGVYGLSEPTLAEGESLDDFLADRSAYEDFDTDAAAARDYHYVDLYEKAVQHLIS